MTTIWSQLRARKFHIAPLVVEADRAISLELGLDRRTVNKSVLVEVASIQERDQHCFRLDHLFRSYGRIAETHRAEENCAFLGEDMTAAETDFKARLTQTIKKVLVWKFERGCEELWQKFVANVAFLDSYSEKDTEEEIQRARRFVEEVRWNARGQYFDGALVKKEFHIARMVSRQRRIVSYSAYPRIKQMIEAYVFQQVSLPLYLYSPSIMSNDDRLQLADIVSRLIEQQSFCQQCARAALDYAASPYLVSSGRSDRH